MYLKSCRILGIKVGANEAEIKKAYRVLAKKHHPDISRERNANEKFIQIRRAYQHLIHVDSYQHYLNRHVNRQRRNVQYASRPQKRTVYKERQYKYRTREHVVEAPEYVIKLSTFLDKIYDYIFIIVGLFMIITPSIYFLLDDELEVSNTGWYPIVFPAITGTLFLYGVYIYMLRHKHPMALKFKARIQKLKKNKGSYSR